MAGFSKVIGAVLLVLGLIVAGFGGYLMFVAVPKAVDEAAFPHDFDDHFVYGGYIDKLNTGNGKVERANFTVDRHIKVVDELEDGKIVVDENIKAKVNGTADTYLPDLAKHNIFHVDDKDLTLYYVNNTEGYEETYTDADDVNWVFPIPVDNEKKYRIWSMNLLDWSNATYLGKEERGGVECYVFRGEEINYEVPLPASVRALLGPLASGSKMKLTLWEKAWVHPMTGTIVDYAKEIKQYLYLPELPAIPEIKYPSDLSSTTGFGGRVTIFDPATATFNSFDDILAVRTIEVVEDEGYLLTANETVEVTTLSGIPLTQLNSAFQVIFNATTGRHDGMGRSGQYLFPPTGVQMANYSVWDDGFGKELTAVYDGMDNTTFAPLTAYRYVIDVVNETYLAGGTSSLHMVYWIEPQTGIVLDASKKLTNWRPQNARRLPLDTAMINKTVHLNTTITTNDPMTGETSTMEIVAEQMINCTGYTDATFAVAKVQETVTKYLSDGSPMGPPVVSKFGVDAATMAYTDAPGWSDTTRTGVFTFPIGLWNETGAVTPSFVLYNSDLMTSAPAFLTTQYGIDGLQAAEYTMKLDGIPLTWDQVSATLGKPVMVPGGSAAYGCNFTYVVDINTGTILDISRSMRITLSPPTYEWLYLNLDSTSALKGAIAGTNVTLGQHILSSGLTTPITGIAMINITTTAVLDNGTDFLPPSTMLFPINISSHEVLNATLQPTGTYWLFPKNPTAKPGYPMMMTLAGIPLLGIAVPIATTAVNVTYVWTNHTQMPGSLVNPALAAFNLNTTISYTWLVDITTGAVLDAKAQLDFELPIPPGYSNNTFMATDDTKNGWAVANKMIGWAISGMPIPVLIADASLADDEAAAAGVKAAYTGGLLLIADGKKPALDLDLAFNATTKGMMKATAIATKAQLAQLPLLMQAHALDALLKSKSNLVAFVYYKQVDEDVKVYDGVDGSVKYWGEFSKEKDDEVTYMGTTLPTMLYVIGFVMVIIGLLLLLMAKKPEEEAPAEEE